MDRLAGLLLAVGALVAGAQACAVPHGGCRIDVCSTYSGVSAATVDFPGASYDDPATWSQGSLPLIGYYLGKYNKLVNGGSYNRAAIKDTPGLNYEHFDLQKSISDPSTGSPYASPSPEGDIVSCCKKCAQTDGCYLFQFFPPDTPADFNDGVACYLLSGGTSTWDWPERGTPYAGSFRKQTNGARATIPPSFVGGRCNGSTGIVDDPHFTGARGTRFDFNGQIGKSFCLTTDRSLHINGLLKGYREARTEGATLTPDGKGLRTWLRELAFIWRETEKGAQQRTLHLVARDGPEQRRAGGFVARATIDGAPFAMPGSVGQTVSPGGDVSITFTGVSQVGRTDVEHFHVTIRGLGDFSVAVRPAHPHMQAPGEAEVHFNLLLNKLQASPAIHGVLGQTYRASPEQEAKAAKFSQLTRLLNGPIQADGSSGEGFLEGDTKDYVTTSITATDCKFSAFQ